MVRHRDFPQIISDWATLENAESQARNLEQQQIAERFAKSVEQLGRGGDVDCTGASASAEPAGASSEPSQHWGCLSSKEGSETLYLT